MYPEACNRRNSGVDCTKDEFHAQAFRGHPQLCGTLLCRAARPSGHLTLGFGTDAGTQALGPCNPDHKYVAATSWLYFLPTNEHAGGTGNRVGDEGVLVATAFGRCHQASGTCGGVQADAMTGLTTPGYYQVTGKVSYWDVHTTSQPPNGSATLVDTRFFYDGLTISPA